MTAIAFTNPDDDQYFETEEFLRKILTPFSKELHVLRGSSEEQFKSFIDLLEKHKINDLMLISHDAIPTPGTLKLLTNTSDKSTRTLVGRLTRESTPDIYVSRNFVENGESLEMNGVRSGMLIVSKEDIEQLKTTPMSIFKDRTGKSGVSPFDFIFQTLVQESTVSIVDGRDFVISRYLTIKDKREHFESHVMNGDEEALLRKAAVKDWDNLWTSIAVSPWTQYVAFWFSKRSITPNQVTIGSFALTLFAATAFALNDFWLNVAGAILVQLSFGADCIDGQLARMIGKFSRLGAWLDWMSDRIKELLLVVGLGIGSVTEGNSWDMSFAVLMIFVLRSAVNESFEMHRSHSVPNDSVQSQPLGFIGLERKVKNFITLPYGNRMGLISICIIVFDADMTLRILFLWSAFAATYQLLGRTLRGGGAKTVNTGILRDDGPITKWLLDRLPKVYGELSVFAFISIFLLLWLLTNKWILALLAVIGLCIASFPLVSRSIWLGPVFTCVAEFAVFWSALLVTDEKYHWIFISVLLLSGISRVIISTGLRFQRLSAHHSKRFSWEERSALMLVTFLIWPPLSSLVGLLLLIKMKKSLRHQIRALHLPQ